MSINTLGSNEKKKVTSWKKLGATFALASVLLATTPQEAKSQKSTSDTTLNTTEVSVSDTTHSDTSKEHTISFTKGCNILETGVTHKGDARIRNYANVGLDIKLGKKETLQLGYSGMNEFTQNLGSYFGRHVPNIGISGLPKLKAIGIIKTTADGILDSKYGLRYLVSDQAGVDYGRIDVAGNEKGASATFFLGKNIGKKGTNVELLMDVQVDGKNKRVLPPYTELQLNQSIAKGFNVFMRGEVPGVKYKEGTYLLGVSKTL